MRRGARWGWGEAAWVRGATGTEVGPAEALLGGRWGQERGGDGGEAAWVRLIFTKKFSITIHLFLLRNCN